MVNVKENDNDFLIDTAAPGLKKEDFKLHYDNGRLTIFSEKKNEVEEKDGGKICAAIDRQHLRDIFDIKLLLDNEGVTDDIWQGFLIGLISHYKPISELLSPVLKDQKSAFDNQFSGMTNGSFSYDDYEQTRNTLIELIQERLTENDKKFLLSFESGEPDWSLFLANKAKDLPAVKWKLQNIQRLNESNPKKHEEMVSNLKVVIGIDD